jgi:ParB/RepB/Spo0J family partition protein
MVETFPLELILPPDPILRTINKNSVKFRELVDQIRENGGPDNIPPARRVGERAQIADGYRRFEAVKEAGLKTMDLNVSNMTDQRYITTQIRCNADHPDIDIIAFARHMDRLRFSGNRDMTLAELSEITKKSTTWVKRILSLNQLHPEVAQLVKFNMVPVGSGQLLAKLPKEQQREHIPNARSMKLSDFSHYLLPKIREHRSSVSQGKIEERSVDGFHPAMRKFKIIMDELQQPSTIPMLLASKGITNPLEAAMLALKWAFRLDPDTIEERRQRNIQSDQQRVKSEERRRLDRKVRVNPDATLGPT